MTITSWRSLCVLPLLLCQIAGARNLFVNHLTGSDEHDGSTPETAFATIRRAVRAAAPGDIIRLAKSAAPYRQHIAIRGVTGTPDRPLVIDGGGAVLSGLKPIPAEQWQEREGGRFFFPAAAGGALRPFLVEHGKPIPAVRNADAIRPGTACWTREGVLFMPAAGRTIADYHLEGTLLSSGVAIANASYITVRNLVCEFFANDGFNVHGDCRGLLFQNIEARWNGDDGFSLHEDVSAVVHGGHFHHNTFGIQDVHAARSMYNGVLVEDNRSIGIDFHGGFHSVIDAVVRNNATNQIRIGPNGAAHLGYTADNPMVTGLVFLKNVSATGGKVGLSVRKGARTTAASCGFARTGTGIVAEAGARLHLLDSVVAHCLDREVDGAADAAVLDYNVYHPGRMAWAGTEYAPEAWEAYRSTSGQDQHSLLAEPEFRGSAVLAIVAPRLLRGEKEIVPGPAPDACVPTLAVTGSQSDAKSPAAHAAQRYDFETHNPWSRVYSVPERNRAGATVAGTSELSSDQAHSGQRSAKLTVRFPDAPPEAWKIKLFSTKFAYARPVRALSFQLYGDGSGRVVRPRVRDAGGESFYGPTLKLDWTGWKEVGWDLDATPPDPVAGGNQNKVQDCPPIEIVLEITVRPTGADKTLVLYLDDLEIAF